MASRTICNKALSKSLNIELDWILSYQSRVGPLEMDWTFYRRYNN